MTIVRTEDEIIIRLPSSMNIEEVQKLIDFLRFREITSKSKATVADIEQLVASVKKEKRARTLGINPRRQPTR